MMDLDYYFRKSLDKAREEGRREGLSEVQHELRIDNAKKLIEVSQENGLSDEVIKKGLKEYYPNLTPEELAAIFDEYHLG
ncbi:MULTISPECIES: hypothetical protein [Lactobacillus]|uniref:Uncharacterized protein n=1 Tax=Lactobacillus xujianguonis TaxID=2495899 RepID=A0A437SSF5_9LACO|nr:MULTISPECIES: hypothetical protein [Lactobacillus]RVU69850.1 hypothetical protein EJK17_10855 [Lactobacillus xujianguonis]RVU72080.1 hypothetical protein EJK20_10905 [Lactobacillus xujianguonis]